MALISSIGAYQNPLLSGLQPTRTDSPTGPVKLPGISTGGTTGAQPGGFGKMVENLISSVDSKQNEAASLTKDVLLGKNDQLHQSMIAMQEAGTAFQLMVEVRNKVVESYQELMRMQA
ncbi:MAG TPA: flagellar hook-basal body complex protein FliE [Opitutaceae bacterium]|nr:flagellar hook-basal body complex protein FliE [Opitutaceae bacterium]